MSVGLYDNAVTAKIKSWILDPNLTLLYPDETNRIFRQVIDEKDDRPLSLPLIAISRGRDIDIVIPTKRPLSSRGKVFNATDKASDHLNAIPIKLNYQIDIYTRRREEADEYLRNFTFQIINHPTLHIELPYRDCHIKQTSYMTIVPTLEDNSDIPERKVPGQFTRETIRFTLDDAYFYAYETALIPKISEVGLYADEIDNKATQPDITIEIPQQSSN